MHTKARQATCHDVTRREELNWAATAGASTWQLDVVSMASASCTAGHRNRVRGFCLFDLLLTCSKRAEGFVSPVVRSMKECGGCGGRAMPMALLMPYTLLTSPGAT